MNQLKLEKAIKRVTKNEDLYIDFMHRGVNSGTILGGEQLEFSYRISKLDDRDYAIYLGDDESVAIHFDDYVERSI